MSLWAIKVEKKYCQIEVRINHQRSVNWLYNTFNNSLNDSCDWIEHRNNSSSVRFRLRTRSESINIFPLICSPYTSPFIFQFQSFCFHCDIPFSAPLHLANVYFSMYHSYWIYTDTWIRKLNKSRSCKISTQPSWLLLLSSSSSLSWSATAKQMCVHKIEFFLSLLGIARTHSHEFYRL